jgi:HEAT repeat protein
VAIRTLWEYDDTSLVAKFLNLLETDQDVDVRAALITALGKYVYLGEIDKIPPETHNLIVGRLRGLASGTKATPVKRRALESLGYSGNAAVPGLINEAYRSGKDDLVCSAMVAMGRSANPEWASIVLNELTSDSPEVCLEAIKSAGELELQGGTETLINFLDHEASGIRMAAIWALSHIGGKGGAEVLEELLEHTEDDIEAELITEALDNLAVSEDIELFSLFELGDDEGDGEQLNHDLLDHAANEDTIH